MVESSAVDKQLSKPQMRSGWSEEDNAVAAWKRE